MVTAFKKKHFYIDLLCQNEKICIYEMGSGRGFSPFMPSHFLSPDWSVIEEKIPEPES
jgi:hypothetical protein